MQIITILNCKLSVMYKLFNNRYFNVSAYCVQLVCDKTHGFEIYGERRAVLREQLMTEEVQGKEQ